MKRTTIIKGILLCFGIMMCFVCGNSVYARDTETAIQKRIVDKSIYQGVYKCYNNGFLNSVKFTTLGNDLTGIIKPRNPEQMIAFDMIKNDESAVKLITGKWGSGKTLILCTAAIEAIMSGKFEKIVWIRNNI